MIGIQHSGSARSLHSINARNGSLNNSDCDSMAYVP